MLKPKLKKCKGCGFDKVIWKDDKCVGCCTPGFKKLESKGTGLKSFTTFKKKRKSKSPETREFFKTQVAFYQENPNSFESGKPIGFISGVNIAHIFPKELYKSIAHEPQNIILLTWEEHTRFDELLNRHEFEKLEKEFKSWDKICVRIRILLSLCKEEGKLKSELTKYLKLCQHQE